MTEVPTNPDGLDQAGPDALDPVEVDQAVRDIGEVPAVEVITTVALHLMSAAAVKCGLGEEGDAATDLDEARKLINALAGLVVTSAPDLGHVPRRPAARRAEVPAAGLPGGLGVPGPARAGARREAHRPGHLTSGSAREGRRAAPSARTTLTAGPRRRPRAAPPTATSGWRSPPHAARPGRPEAPREPDLEHETRCRVGPSRRRGPSGRVPGSTMSGRARRTWTSPLARTGPSSPITAARTAGSAHGSGHGSPEARRASANALDAQRVRTTRRRPAGHDRRRPGSHRLPAWPPRAADAPRHPTRPAAPSP